MANTLRGEILTQFCYSREKILFLFGAVSILLVLAIVGVRVLEPGTATYVINFVNLISLSVVGLVSGVLLVYCFRTDAVYR